MRQAILLTALAAIAASAGACEPPSEQRQDRRDASMRIREEPIQAIELPKGGDAALIDLGRRLFHETRLSADSTVSCASCHVVKDGGDDGLARSKGVGGTLGIVNAPTVLNSGFNFALFWDGRAATLEDQVDGPLTNPAEMAFDWASALRVLSADPGYTKSFAGLFPDGISRENVKKAVVAYERALVTPSRFDRWLGGEAAAITDDEKRGYDLFKSMGCIACHQGRNVGGNMFQRFGVMGDYFGDRGSVTTADYGRYNVTKEETDRYVFRVPTLRNVALTAPYFHDGSAATLPDAIGVMAKYQLGREIAKSEIDAIAGFLATLSGEVRPELLAEAGAR